MIRTSVLLPDDVAKELKYEAGRRHTTASEIVRQAVTEHLHAAAAKKKGFLSLAGMFDSGRSDISERMEELLNERINEIARASGLEPRRR